MRSWIYHAKGRHVRQAPVGLGDLREEHISRQGSFGSVAMIYRDRGPNEILRVEGPLCPRRVADIGRVEPTDQLRPARHARNHAVQRRCQRRGQPQNNGDAMRVPEHRRRPAVFHP